jgi:hypothetical protein
MLRHSTPTWTLLRFGLLFADSIVRRRSLEETKREAGGKMKKPKAESTPAKLLKVIQSSGRIQIPIDPDRALLFEKQKY